MTSLAESKASVAVRKTVGKLTVRKLHKWLAMIIGVQMLIWMTSGLYMASIDISTIHGNHLVEAKSRPLVNGEQLKHLAIEPFDIERVFEEAIYKMSLINRFNEVWYQVESETGRALYALNQLSNTITNQPQPLMITEKHIEMHAKQVYTGDHPIRNVTKLTAYPREIGGRAKPIWQVEFEHWLNPTLYFDVNTGELVRKRSDLWRWFDLFWMLHIMDYEERENINNRLLQIVSTLGCVFVITGVILLTRRFFHKRKVVAIYRR